MELKIPPPRVRY